MNNKKTKIVATMGPACSNKNTLKEMILKGVNVCRLNFSHGSHEDHLKTINMVKDLNHELQSHVALLADLQGPKIRIGKMEDDQFLVPDEEVTITSNECLGNKNLLYINYTHFPQDVKPGELVLLDDGKLTLEILSTNGVNEVKAKVVYGGKISSNKGVNLPNTAISQPSLTDKDRLDLEFALEHDVDWVGLSFVRSARDIIELKHLINKEKKNARIIAKIEKPEALEDIDNILVETDAIMVARGDLGVEIPMQNVPLVQKMLIKKSLKHAKPVIVATQMMESMIEASAPTRAEVNDVANAVLDGADAVMLSGETSVGKYPVHVIDAMAKIVKECESSDQIYHREEAPEKNQNRFITDSICFNACRLVKRVNAQAIITMTHSGYTGYKISSQRPNCKIFVFTSNKKILNQISLIWGVEGIFYDKMVSTDHTIADIKYLLKKNEFLNEGDLVINIASMPIEEKGNSNMLKLSYV